MLLVAIGFGTEYAIDQKLEAAMFGLLLLVCGVAIFIGHITILFGRLFGGELHKKTLSSLLMLPIGRNSLVGQSVAGLLPGIAASASCLIIGFVIMVQTERRAQVDVYDTLKEPWAYVVPLTAVLTVYLGLLFSIRLRYGGMLLAVVGIWMLSPFLLGGLFQVFWVVCGPTITEKFFEYGLPWLLIQVEIPLCVWIHVQILRSLDRAGEMS